ncbi:MAG: hypothetical protein M3Q23_09975 [Actinomycetota bacterium]|nr:hypothetical protein [Actinomycetota bacterium]
MAIEASGEAGVARGAGALGVLKVVLGVLAVLSAVAGVLLLAIPGSTASFFAWGLGPPPLAAICGGFFVGVAAAFAYSRSRAAAAGRGLCLMGIVFAVPTLGYTLINKSVFDFGRWQAVLWLAVFIAASVVFVVLPFAGGWRLGAVGPGPGLPLWARAILLVLTVAGIVGAVSLWIDPVGSGAWLPFAPPPLGGRFLGVWSMVVAFACLWAAIRPAVEGEPFVFGAAALVLGAVVGTLRGFGDLERGPRWAFLGVLVVALALILFVHPPARRASGARSA